MKKKSWAWWRILEGRKYFDLAKELDERCDRQDEVIAKLSVCLQSMKKAQQLLEYSYQPIIRFVLKNDTCFIITYYQYTAISGAIKLEYYLHDSFEPSKRHLANLFVEQSGRELYIEDLQLSLDRVNHGYGSILMEELLQYAKVYSIQIISGTLSVFDLRNHSERLEHFYRKFGFQITDIVEDDGTIQNKMINLKL